ncbi:hypothetical protein C8Q76DRAFT_467404 [Earliella scabrosa]|nr:hypothetical protein C8Q76DRAFT_467404 [Earliella scabrosa]
MTGESTGLSAADAPGPTRSRQCKSPGHATRCQLIHLDGARLESIPGDRHHPPDPQLNEPPGDPAGPRRSPAWHQSSVYLTVGKSACPGDGCRKIGGVDIRRRAKAEKEALQRVETKETVWPQTRTVHQIEGAYGFATRHCH